MGRLYLVLLVFVACGGEARPKLEVIEAGSGDVAQLVSSQLSAAARDHKQLLVYVGAPWCEPCRRFHDAATAGQLDDAFGQLRILEFDADSDGEALARAGYKSELVPLFAVPKPDGTASGRQIEGSIKGDGAVAQITPRLRTLLDGR